MTIKIKNHGNGFLRLYHQPLNDDCFIHVYSPDIPRQRVDTSIHDHRWSFSSEIIHGILRHIVYEVILGTDYVVHHSDKNDDLISSYMQCSLKLISDEVYEAGNWYQLNAGEIHQVIPQGLTITKVTRSKPSSVQARIFVPTGVQPDNEFDNRIKF